LALDGPDVIQGEKRYHYYADVSTYDGSERIIFVEYKQAPVKTLRCDAWREKLYMCGPRFQAILDTPDKWTLLEPISDLSLHQYHVDGLTGVLSVVDSEFSSCVPGSSVECQDHFESGEQVLQSEAPGAREDASVHNSVSEISSRLLENVVTPTGFGVDVPLACSSHVPVEEYDINSQWSRGETPAAPSYGFDNFWHDLDNIFHDLDNRQCD